MSNQAYQLPFRRVGEDVQVWDKARVLSAEVISVGDSVIIDDFVFLMGGQRTELGSFVHLAAFAGLVGGGELFIEDFAGVSGGVRIYTGSDDFLGGSLTGPTVPAGFRGVTRSFVRLGRHAVIGANSVILPGVTVGEGAAVGACSLVNCDLEPWTVYAGSPARPLRARPFKKMLALEAELRETLYDARGRYRPRREREVAA
jgi:galactoside O-acetyltransferase